MGRTAPRWLSEVAQKSLGRLHLGCHSCHPLRNAQYLSFLPFLSSSPAAHQGHPEVTSQIHSQLPPSAQSLLLMLSCTGKVPAGNSPWQGGDTSVQESKAYVPILLSLCLQGCTSRSPLGSQSPVVTQENVPPLFKGQRTESRGWDLAPV